MIPRPQERVYLRPSFNAAGDIVSSYIDNTKYRFDLITGYPDSYEGEVQNINGFVKGARAPYMFPNSSETLAKTQHSSIKKFERDIYARLNCPVLNRTQTFVLPDSVCLDTMFHLNSIGKIV